MIESVGEKGSLITDYTYEQNIYADNQFMKDYLEQQGTFEEGAFLVADGAYSSETNSQIASSHNLRLVTTNLLATNQMKYMLTLNFPMMDIFCLHVSTDVLRRNVPMIPEMIVLLPTSK